MIALLQRVSAAGVTVEGEFVARIDKGLLVLLGIEKGDDQAKADKLVHRMLGYRLFEDEQGKMNLSLQDIGGQLLLVPQFTLAADTNRGMRPSFSSAATPQQGEFWFNEVARQCSEQVELLQLGRFGADMQVELVNDGPVTFWLQV